MLSRYLNLVNSMQSQPALTAPQMPVAPEPQPVEESGGIFDNIFSAKGLLSPDNRYLLGAGLLAKMNNPKGDIISPAFDKLAAFKKQNNISALASDIQNSPYAKDPATQKIISELVATGDPDMIKRAMDVIKPPDPYTTKPGDIRYDGLGNVLTDRSNESDPLNDYRQQRNNLIKWTSLPADWRSNTLAIGSALGFSAQETENAYLSGKSLKEMAKEKGIPENLIPNPAYPPTKAQINAVQQRRAALSEMNVLDDFISKAQAPYSRRVNGYSLNFIGDAVSSDPKAQERASDNVAAKILQTENFAARFKSLGGNVSEAAIDKLMTESLANFKIPGVTLSPAIWSQAQAKVKQKLIEAATSANDVVLRSGMSSANQDEAPQPDVDVPPGMAKMRDNKGVPVYVPVGQISKAITEGGYSF